MLGYTLSDQLDSARLTGIPVASMQQSPLGTLSFDMGSRFVAAGGVLVTVAGGRVVVYRIS
jgi:hypothetical protein